MTSEQINDIISDSAAVKRKLAEECSEDILRCGELLAQVALDSGLIMLCGNGGSAADSQHLAAELVVRLRSSVDRRAIGALALTVDTSILTAGGNDYGFEHVFARQVEAYGREGDVLIAISTSGNSENVIAAVEQANADDMHTIGLLGGDGGELKDLVDDYVLVPSSVTARIQEAHILIGHIWCEMIEDAVVHAE
ncbi:MAG: D-sedoheptulose-7-phosphate isomerase [Candidatus Kapaibacteriota bacterium]|jgi:D-sedoheptulose 7-phosphate isomerase